MRWVAGLALILSVEALGSVVGRWSLRYCWPSVGCHGATLVILKDGGCTMGNTHFPETCSDLKVGPGTEIRFTSRNHHSYARYQGKLTAEGRMAGQMASSRGERGTWQAVRRED